MSTSANSTRIPARFPFPVVSSYSSTVKNNSSGRPSSSSSSSASSSNSSASRIRKRKRHSGPSRSASLSSDVNNSSISTVSETANNIGNSIIPSSSPLSTLLCDALAFTSTSFDTLPDASASYLRLPQSFFPHGNLSALTPTPPSSSACASAGDGRTPSSVSTVSMDCDDVHRFLLEELQTNSNSQLTMESALKNIDKKLSKRSLILQGKVKIKTVQKIANPMNSNSNADNSATGSAANSSSSASAATEVLSANLPIRSSMLNPRRQRKHLSSSARRRLGLFHLPSSGLNYSSFAPLHALWCSYISSLFDLNNNSSINNREFSERLLKADFHGAKFVVVRSSSPTYIGLQGICLQETAETFKLICEDNKLKTISKRNSVFQLQIPAKSNNQTDGVDGRMFQLIGNHLLMKSVERSVKKFKFKHTIDVAP